METANTKRKTFRERYCEKFNCPPNEFEKRLFLQAVHRRALILARIILAFSPSSFNSDFLILQRLGEATDPRTAGAEAMDMRSDYLRLHDFGILRRFIKMRISGKRLLSVIDQLWGVKSRVVRADALPTPTTEPSAKPPS